MNFFGASGIFGANIKANYGSEAEQLNATFVNEANHDIGSLTYSESSISQFGLLLRMIPKFLTILAYSTILAYFYFDMLNFPISVQLILSVIVYGSYILAIAQIAARQPIQGME